jgi:outer membrane immunogenic protein
MAMKKLLFAGITAAFCGAPVLAADMPVKAPVYKAAPIAAHNWTGAYWGLTAGYGWNDPKMTLTPNDAAAATVTPTPTASISPNGAVGGLGAGYNWQVNPSWLYGFETDINLSGIKGSGTAALNLGGPAGSLQATEKVDWFGTVRGRLGWLPNDKLLLFATGGFAYGEVKQNAAITSSLFNFIVGNPFGIGAQCTPTCYSGSQSHLATGWTLGAGSEYAFAPNMTFKVEYLYVNLGSNPFNVVGGNPGAFPPTTSSFTAHYTMDFHVVRAGLNWKY